MNVKKLLIEIFLVINIITITILSSFLGFILCFFLARKFGYSIDYVQNASRFYKKIKNELLILLSFSLILYVLLYFFDDHIVSLVGEKTISAMVPPNIFLDYLVAVIAAPIFEEFIFRYFFVTRWSDKNISENMQAWMSSFLFSILHIPYLSLEGTFIAFSVFRVIFTFILGLIFFRVYKKTNLTVVITVHSVYNFIVVILGPLLLSFLNNI